MFFTSIMFWKLSDKSLLNELTQNLWLGLDMLESLNFLSNPTFSRGKSVLKNVWKNATIKIPRICFILTLLRWLCSSSFLFIFTIYYYQSIKVTQFTICCFYCLTQIWNYNEVYHKQIFVLPNLFFCCWKTPRWIS